MSKKKVVNDLYVKAQRSKQCIIPGCGLGGRTVATLGANKDKPIELNYCPHHRKYGERVLNYFVSALFTEELTTFLHETKKDLFQENYPVFCNNCDEMIRRYVNDNIQRLDKINHAVYNAKKKQWKRAPTPKGNSGPVTSRDTNMEGAEPEIDSGEE